MLWAASSVWRAVLQVAAASSAACVAVSSDALASFCRIFRTFAHGVAMTPASQVVDVAIFVHPVGRRLVTLPAPAPYSEARVVNENNIIANLAGERGEIDGFPSEKKCILPKGKSNNLL